MSASPTWSITLGLPIDQPLCTIIGSKERISSAVDILNEARLVHSEDDQGPYGYRQIADATTYPHLPTCPNPDTLVTDYAPSHPRIRARREGLSDRANPKTTPRKRFFARRKPTGSRTTFIGDLLKRLREAKTREVILSPREKKQALVAKLMAGLVIDQPRNHSEDLRGGFMFFFPLVDEGLPDRELVVTFVKTGYRTFSVRGYDNGGSKVWFVGSRTLRGDLPIHRAGAELVIALYGTDFLTNATP